MMIHWQVITRLKRILGQYERGTARTRLGRQPGYT